MNAKEAAKDFREKFYTEVVAGIFEKWYNEYRFLELEGELIQVAGMIIPPKLRGNKHVRVVEEMIHVDFKVSKKDLEDIDDFEEFKEQLFPKYQIIYETEEYYIFRARENLRMFYLPQLPDDLRNLNPIREYMREHLKKLKVEKYDIEDILYYNQGILMSIHDIIMDVPPDLRVVNYTNEEIYERLKKEGHYYNFKLYKTTNDYVHKKYFSELDKRLFKKVIPYFDEFKFMNHVKKSGKFYPFFLHDGRVLEMIIKKPRRK